VKPEEFVDGTTASPYLRSTRIAKSKKATRFESGPSFFTES
jgi:hypothetical protein